MVERLADLDHEPIVGRFYLVPTVTGIYYNMGPRPWPVLLPFHEDQEVLGFKPWHYHPDPRFIPDRVWRSLDNTGGYFVGRGADEAIAGSPLQTHAHLNAGGLPRPIEKRRKCIRPMPDRSWLSGTLGRKLRPSYRDKKLGADMICPHKGVCLKSMPVVDGVVTCPAHGLQWNVETGRMVVPDSEKGSDHV